MSDVACVLRLDEFVFRASICDWRTSFALFLAAYLRCWRASVACRRLSARLSQKWHHRKVAAFILSALLSSVTGSIRPIL